MGRGPLVHVDDLSSAHVYLRYPAPGTKHKPAPITDIPPALVAECSQLVKANSIEGCKKASVRVIYTPASNLKKTASMKTGQVSYHDMKLVRRTTIEKEKAIAKALDKTREELCVRRVHVPACSARWLFADPVQHRLASLPVFVLSL